MREGRGRESIVEVGIRWTVFVLVFKESREVRPVYKRNLFYLSPSGPGFRWDSRGVFYSHEKTTRLLELCSSFVD